MDKSVREWAASASSRHPELIKLGYFGSYARGDNGVGSDLDLVAIVRECAEPFENRTRHWDLSALPVPTDLLIYTVPEWSAMLAERTRFARTLSTETVWVFNA